jgi:hypothetical protein
MAVAASTEKASFVRPVIAAVIVIALAWVVCASVSPLVLTTWMGVAWMATVPAQVVIGPVWHTGWPPFAANKPQPVKGLLLTLLTVVVGAVCYAWIQYGVGRGYGPPPPMTVMYTITSIIVCLWLALLWRCWPLTVFLKSPWALGLGVVVFSYAVAWALFHLLFNFGFMAGAPVYVEALDPKGMLLAWTPLVFGVTSVSCIMALMLLDFWPITLITKNPVAVSAIGSVVVLALAALILRVVVGGLGMDPVSFMVRFPVSFIFGFFLITAMAENRLFAGMAQPLKGLLLIVCAKVAMFGMYALYAWAAPMLAGTPLASGAPTYDLELWVATAMLGITFPLIIAFTGFFDFWPLKRRS